MSKKIKNYKFFLRENVEKIVEIDYNIGEIENRCLKAS